MASSIDFPGTNKVLTSPAGKEHLVHELHVFNNGRTSVSCWQLSRDEVKEIIESGGKVYLSVMFGTTQPPVFLGSESAVRELNADLGVWKKPRAYDTILTDLGYITDRIAAGVEGLEEAQELLIQEMGEHPDNEKKEALSISLPIDPRLDEAIAQLRKYCNGIITQMNQMGAKLFPNFSKTNQFLKECDKLFRARDTVHGDVLKAEQYDLNSTKGST